MPRKPPVQKPVPPPQDQENLIAVTLGANQWNQLGTWSRGQSPFLTEFAKKITEILIATSGHSVTVTRGYNVWGRLISELQPSALGDDAPAWLPGTVRLIVVQVSDAAPED